MYTHCSWIRILLCITQLYVYQESLHKHFWSILLTSLAYSLKYDSRFWINAGCLVFANFRSITHIEGYKSLYRFIPINSY